MDQYSACVQEFHDTLGIPFGKRPAIRRGELRAKLIYEEALETCAAINRGDLIEAIDGLCDLLVVVHGTALEFGIHIAPFFREVHRTNMLKRDGPVREDGKKLKPPGWKPPDIEGLLMAPNELGPPLRPLDFFTGKLDPGDETIPCLPDHYGDRQRCGGFGPRCECGPENADAAATARAARRDAMNDRETRDRAWEDHFKNGGNTP